MQNLPPAMASFLAARKAGAKPTTPDGKTETIFGKEAAKAGLPMTPPQSTQGGVPPVTPEAGQQGLTGILDQLKQAQQTGPSVAQNQQQAQQQQLAQQAAQMAQQPQPPQQMAEGGLAGLPVKIGEFAEGGVIGYAGPQGSEVEPEEATSDIGDFFRGISGGLQDMVNKGNQRMELERAKYNAQIMPWTAVTKSERAANVRQLQNLNDQLNNLSTPAKPEGSWGEPEKRASEQNSNLNRLVNTLRSGMDETSNYTDKDSLRSSLEGLQALIPSKTSKSGTAQANVARNVVEQPKSEETLASPNLSKIMTDMQAAGFTKPDLSEMNRIYAAQKEHVENRPDFGAQDIATANKIHEMAQAQDTRQRQLAQLAASPLTPGGGARIAAVTANFEQAVAGRDAAQLRFVDAAKQAEYARQTKDLDALAKAQADMIAANQKYQEFSAQLASHMYSSDAGITAAKIAASSREEVANTRAYMAERIADLRVASALNGKTANLKDPSYVADKISDNVSKQMEEMQKNPRLGINIKTAADWINLRRQLTADEVVFWKVRGADVSGVNVGSAAPVASGKNYTFDSLK